MRYALLSDIHSNLSALEAVFQEIETHHPDEILCLGDIVGYGPFPNECIKLIQDKCDLVLKGNHDFAIESEAYSHQFNIFAKQAIDWTVQKINRTKYRLS